MEKNAMQMVEAIQKQSQQELKQLQDDFHVQRETAIRLYHQEAQEESRHYVEQELSELRHDLTQNETQFKWRIKKNLFIKREELVEGLFAKLKIRLVEYSSSEEYREQFLQRAKTVLHENPDLQNGILLVKTGETAYYQSLVNHYPELKIQEQEDITVGGFILQDITDKMAIDKTLDHQIKIQKEWFFANSELHF